MKNTICIGISVLVLSTVSALAHDGDRFHGGQFHGWNYGLRGYGRGFQEGFRGPAFGDVGPEFHERRRIFVNPNQGLVGPSGSPDVCIGGVCCPAADFYAGICTPD